MFNRLVGAKPRHPMADMRKARELLAELTEASSLKALEQAVSWLGSIRDTREFPLDQRANLTFLIDQAVKSHQYRLAQEYTDALRLQKSYESRVWNASFGFWKALADGYIDCVEQFQAGAHASDEIRNDMPRIVGRVLRSLTLQIKWILLRYGLVEDRIWRDLGRAYLFAESQGCAGQRVAIYPGLHGESSAREEFLKALMLAVSSPDSLSPAKIHIAERAIAHFAARFTLLPAAAPGCHFYFDLSMHRPPVRILRDLSPGPMMRFFGAGDAAQGLQDLIGAIEHKDGVPNDINLGGNFDKATVLEVLAHLKQYWSGKPPLRNNRRRDLATRITIVPGFVDALRWADVLADSSSLEFSDPANAESWIVFNVSDTGYGAIVPKINGEWLQIGSLIAIHPETATNCRTGVIRRFTKDRYGQHRVGIEVLGHIAQPVRLTPATRAADPAEHGGAALLLSAKPDKNGEVPVLMRAGGFIPTQDLQMRVHEKTYRMTPSRLIEGGKDFDLASLRVAGQG
jgi:hypothetical protein